MTPSSEQELREAIKKWALERDERLSAPGASIKFMKSELDQIMHLINEQVAVAVTKTEKAYGGCHICYGKGYATVNDRWAGADEWTGKRYETGSRNAMKFCSCERGKQLVAQLKQRKEK